MSIKFQLLKCVMNLFIKCGRGGDMIYDGYAVINMIMMIMVMITRMSMVFNIHMVVITGYISLFM